MTIRNKLNQNPVVATAGAVLLLVICVGLIVLQFAGGGREPGQAYFYDTASDEIFTARATLEPIVPPGQAEGEGEATGYRALIFACGECGDYAGMTRDELKQTGAALGNLMKSSGGSQQGDDNQGGGTVISDPDQLKWVSSMSSAGKRVVRVDLQCEEPGSRTTCEP